jgi:hypothetical protein
MSDFNVSVPIYLVNGILESGKTSFLNFTIRQEYFQSDETTLLISCEEGEEEYDAEDLKKYNTYLEIIEEEEDFTFETLRSLHRKYHPGRVLLEYNPLWSTKKLREMKLPLGWGISQEIVTIDGTSYQVYRNNMQSVFSEMVQNADMVIFNRCKKDDPLTNYRRGIKVVNPACEISFEDENGELIDLFEEQVPYDMNAPVIQIEDVDYGIFYVDMDDHPEKYVGKKVCFKARAMKSKKKEAEYFVPGRKAMTCCADDMQMIGYLCKTPLAPQLKHGEWVEVTAKVAYEFAKLYRGKGPVLYASSVTPCQPPVEEMVYFN